MAKNMIILNRGDSLDLTLALTVDGVSYTMQEGDFLYFGVMRPDQKFEDAFIRQRYTKDDYTAGGYLVIKLKPEDSLYLLPGVYYYSLKLKKADGTVITLLPKTKFVIQD